MPALLITLIAFVVIPIASQFTDADSRRPNAKNWW
jgi:hypothetical protein